MQRLMFLVQGITSPKTTSLGKESTFFLETKVQAKELYWMEGDSPLLT